MVFLDLKLVSSFSFLLTASDRPTPREIIFNLVEKMRNLLLLVTASLVLSLTLSFRPEYRVRTTKFSSKKRYAFPLDDSALLLAEDAIKC